MTIKSLTDIASVRPYLARIRAEARSLKKAVVREDHGAYWKDIAIIRFKPDGEVTCDNEEYAPTESEREAIKAEFANVKFPELKPLKRLIKLPDELKKAKAQDVFEFRNAAGDIVMVQRRSERKEGEKVYEPWTFWSDDVWRNCEPDGPLPLFNAHRLKDEAIVFIHEGAKAARHVQWMVDGETAEAREALKAHPWGQEMKYAVHVGWIGGALSPHRTDWDQLKAAGIKRAYIVADNDAPGRAAIAPISKHLRLPTFSIQFTQRFPASFDLADQFPKAMFKDGFYTGPLFRTCLHPATWATDEVRVPKQKPYHFLRDSFKEMWGYIEELGLYVCKEMPEIMLKEEELNKHLASFSHIQNTARLIDKTYTGRIVRVCYKPDVNALICDYRGSSAINLHVPSDIRARAGDAGPWLEFLAYMFPDEGERNRVTSARPSPKAA